MNFCTIAFIQLYKTDISYLPKKLEKKSSSGLFQMVANMMKLKLNVKIVIFHGIAKTNSFRVLKSELNDSCQFDKFVPFFDK